MAPLLAVHRVTCSGFPVDMPVPRTVDHPAAPPMPSFCRGQEWGRVAMPVCALRPMALARAACTATCCCSRCSPLPSTATRHPPPWPARPLSRRRRRAAPRQCTPVAALPCTAGCSTTRLVASLPAQAWPAARTSGPGQGWPPYHPSPLARRPPPSASLTAARHSITAQTRPAARMCQLVGHQLRAAPLGSPPPPHPPPPLPPLS